MKRKLREIIRHKGPEVHTIDIAATVIEAVHKMNECHVGALLVLKNEKPSGIFTERDILRRVVDAKRDPAKTPVKDVMTKELVTVSSDTTVEQAMQIVTEKRCRHLPIIDGDSLEGMISIGDLTRSVTEDQKQEIEGLIQYINGPNLA